MEQLALAVRAISALNSLVGRVFAWLSLAIVLVCFVVVVAALRVPRHPPLPAGPLRLAVGRDVHRRRRLRHAARRPCAGRYPLPRLVATRQRHRRPHRRRRLPLPFIIVVLVYAWPYVARSWRLYEGSANIGGMPGLFILKTFIIVFCVVVGLQGHRLGLPLRSSSSPAREDLLPPESALQPRAKPSLMDHRPPRRDPLRPHVRRRHRHAAAWLPRRLQPRRHGADLRADRLAARRLRPLQLRLGHHPLPRHHDQRSAGLGAALHLHGRDAGAHRHRRAAAAHHGQALRQPARRPRLSR